jgi:fibronectin type 3 domain-containing protein
VTKPDGISPTNSYLDGGLRPATIYYYKVAAVDNAGNIGAVSRTGHGKTKNINTINTEENSKPPSHSSTSTSSGLKSQEFAGTATRDYTPPTQVAGLIASTQSSTQINLAWKSNTEADFHHYNIYRGTNSGFGVNPRGTPPVGTSTENSFSNTGLNPSTKYYYKVAAVDKAGNIGTLSLERSATTSSSSSSPPPDTAPPAQVTGLTVSVQSSTQLKLTWNSNSEADFNHYNIYRGTSSGFTVNPGVTQPVGTSKANSYYNTGLSPSTKYYYKVAAVDNSGNIGARSSERSGTTSGSQNPNLYDDFEGGTYILSDGQKSPNGKWINRYNGFGQVGVKEESNGNNILYEFPQTSKQKGETHASLLLSTQKVSNGIIEFDMRTDKQLRINDPPNTWEAAWVMWRYGDDFHHYYFVLKTNGIEFGKKDTSCHCEEQVFLKTGSSPKLQMGTWTHVKISSIGAHTSIWLNGVLVVDMDDPSYSRTADMSSGFVGLYNEDAAVSFDNISLSPQ